MPNERVFDQVNTIMKLAQKRSFVGAVILAANASNYFAGGAQIAKPGKN